MKFNIQDCEVDSGSSENGKYYYRLTHKPSGKIVERMTLAPLTEEDRVWTIKNLTDIVEGRKSSPKQLLCD